MAKRVPLSIIMEETKKTLSKSVADVMSRFKVPAYIVEPLLAEVLAEVRDQKNIELMEAYESMENADGEQEEPTTKEGE